MAIPPEWDVATSVGRSDVTVETPAGATVRANAVSPVTLIPVREPLITDRQVTCCLLVACIMLAAIVVQLSMGVPLHTVAVTALTYLGGTCGTVEGYHLTQATNGTMVVVQPGGLDPVTVLVGSSLMFTAMALALHALFECGFYDTMREIMVRACGRIRRIPRIV